MSLCVCDSCGAYIDSDHDPECCLGAEHHWLVICERCREWDDDGELDPGCIPARAALAESEKS